MFHHAGRKSAIGLISLLLSIGIACGEATSGGTDPLDAMERSLEMAYHERLIMLKAEPGSEPLAFSTDGCSGGLSAGWSYLVSVVPEARETHGDLPPWESCCVAHDRLYHMGGIGVTTATESFEARKDADLALKSCVLATGADRAPRLAKAYDLTDDQVKILYESIAALMYRAVRIGGMPCSGLPWRWSYGWPQCE